MSPLSQVLLGVAIAGLTLSKWAVQAQVIQVGHCKTIGTFGVGGEAHPFLKLGL